MKGIAASLTFLVCMTTVVSPFNDSGSNQWVSMILVTPTATSFFVASSTKGPSSSGKKKLRAGWQLISNALLNYWSRRCGWRAILKSSLLRKHYPHFVPWSWKLGSYAFVLKWFPQMFHRWPLKIISSKTTWIFKKIISDFLVVVFTSKKGYIYGKQERGKLSGQSTGGRNWHMSCEIIHTLTLPLFPGFEKCIESLQKRCCWVTIAALCIYTAPFFQRVQGGL